MVRVNEFITEPDLLIDFQNVSVVRSGRTLLAPLNWKVELDERWVVIGPNGAGKTTLLRIAAAQDFPTEGAAFVLGERLGRTDMRDLRAAIGVTSSDFASRVPAEENVGDLVVSAGYAVVGRWREHYDEMDYAQAREQLAQVGALHLIDRTWGTLSDGEKKRVLLARAMMIDPELMLMDEPAAGMDLGGREDLVAYLGDLALDPDAPAMVVITHHLEEIPYGFTHALLLDEGTVVAQGLIEDVLTSELVSQAYHQPIDVTYDDGRFFARRATAKHR